MKTAISIPDKIFRKAERHAKRVKKSRSRLYAEAIEEYLLRHSPDEITEAVNAACAELGEPARDEFAVKAGERTLRRVEW